MRQVVVLLFSRREAFAATESERQQLLSQSAIIQKMICLMQCDGPAHTSDRLLHTQADNLMRTPFPPGTRKSRDTHTPVPSHSTLTLLPRHTLLIHSLTFDPCLTL